MPSPLYLEGMKQMTPCQWCMCVMWLSFLHSHRERLEEDGSFPKRELAALLVSKVYFHLGSYLDSLTYALRSGPMLHQDPNQLYIDTIKGESLYLSC